MYEQIFFIGTGRVAKDCIGILNDNCEKFTCLNVEREDFPVVKPTCKRLGVEYRRFDKSELGEFLSAQNKPTLVISAHNGYIFPRSVTDKDNVTIINFHNAYLPHYRGRNAPTWEIYNGEKFGGATWHLVDSGIDTGGVIVQEQIPIADDEIALSLLTKTANVGVRLFRDNINKIIRGGGGVITSLHSYGKLYLARELPNDGYLNLDWDFESAYRFLRAMDYRGLNIMPLPKVDLKGEIYIVDEYSVCDSDSPRDPQSLYITAGDKVLHCRLKRL